jgi:hypothetical protein
MTILMTCMERPDEHSDLASNAGWVIFIYHICIYVYIHTIHKYIFDILCGPSLETDC